MLKFYIIKNIIDQFFSDVTAALIYTFWLMEPHKTEIPIHNFLLKFLKTFFIKSYSKNPEIAIEMIPKDAIFDAQSKKLTRKVIIVPGVVEKKHCF